MRQFIDDKERIDDGVLFQLMNSGVRTLESLKKADVTHRDIRPENIQVSKDLELTFNHFVVRTGKHFHGSKQYLSGDYIRAFVNKTDGERSMLFSNDVWAFGCTLFELINRRPVRGRFRFFLYSFRRVAALCTASRRHLQRASSFVIFLLPDTHSRQCLQIVTAARDREGIARRPPVGYRGSTSLNNVNFDFVCFFFFAFCFELMISCRRR